MHNETPEDPNLPPDDANLRGKIDKLGDDIDKLEEEALPPPAHPPGIGANLG